MKLYKYITIILLSAVFMTSCNDIKRTLSGDKKENVDQFLVKKKNPLILPPNFDDLPKPQKETKKNVKKYFSKFCQNECQKMSKNIFVKIEENVFFVVVLLQ